MAFVQVCPQFAKQVDFYHIKEQVLCKKKQLDRDTVCGIQG